MITNYVYLYENPENSIEFFIKNSYNYFDYNKCYEACHVILNSWILDKCSLPENLLNTLMYYYANSKKKIKNLN